MPELSALEVQMAIEKLRKHKLPDIDQIAAELIKVGGRTICFNIQNLLILFGMMRNCPRSGRSRSFYLFIRRVIKQIVVITEKYHMFQLYTEFYPTTCCQG